MEKAVLQGSAVGQDFQPDSAVTRGPDTLQISGLESLTY